MEFLEVLKWHYSGSGEVVRTFPPVSLCQLDGSQLWSTAAVPIQGAQTFLMQPDSPGGSFPMSCHLPGSVALSAVGWADAQRSKREIISGYQAEGMAVLVNWKAKLREEKVFLFSKCSLSSEWVWSYGIELPHSQRYLQGYICSTQETMTAFTGIWVTQTPLMRSEFCCTLSHDPVAVYTSRKNIFDKLT